MGRLETAVARAVSEGGHAADTSTVKRILERDQDIRLPSTYPISAGLLSLVKWRRVLLVRRGDSRGTNYFTMSGMTKRLPPVPNTRIVVAREGLQRFARRFGDVPFSTTSLRLYAEGTCGLRMPTSGPMRWTGAMQHLEKTGEVVRLGNVRRIAYWIESASWKRMTPKQRRGWRRELQPLKSGTRASVSLGDRTSPLFISDHHDALRLYAVAERMRNAAIPSAKHRRIIASRPLTLDELLAPLASSGTKKQRTGHRRIIHDVVRHAREKGGQLRYAGRDQGLSYYCVGNRDGHPFTDFLTAVVAAKSLLEWREYRRVRELTRSADPVSCAAKYLREVRISGCAFLGRLRLDHLKAAISATELLPDEILGTDSLVEQLQADLDLLTIAGGLHNSLVHSHALEYIVPAASNRVLLAEVRRHLKATLGGDFGLSFYVSTQFTQLEMTVSSRPERQEADQRTHGETRPARIIAPRLALLFTILRRWGGPIWRATAMAAEANYGAICTEDVAIRALRMEPSRNLSRALIGVLSISDSDAAATVIADGLRAETRVTHRDPLLMESLVFGLLRTPVAGRRSTLDPEHARLLKTIAEGDSDERVRVLAHVVLQSWEEDWADERLLRV